MRTDQYAMKRLLLVIAMCGFAVGVAAQAYDITFRLDGVTDSVMYIGRHHRDRIQLLDSARGGANGVYRFRGVREWRRGMYALVGADGKKAVADFAIDGSQRFTVSGDAKLTPGTVRVKGCAANRILFEYKATVASAREELEAIRERKKEPGQEARAESEERSLLERMRGYEERMQEMHRRSVYFTLTRLLEEADVPESVEDKAYYYRAHYWNRLFAPSAQGRFMGLEEEALLYSRQLYNKVNYFFFGQLYHASSDTINKEIDRLAARIGDDTALLRYVFDHIEPRYFRSSKRIGWDAVWCHLAGEYYLKGRCPWATEGTLHNMRYNYNRLRQSLIGAHGQELWMADSNQSENPKDWISSHRFATKYVVLWFWDPDCHHCQEQSAELAALVDSLRTAPDRRFEVYAVGYESDVEKWKKYLREHHMPFVNVGGTNVNIDYQEAYNVHGAPTMIILNERRDIIMNKTIPIKHLLRFLDDYEKQHP